MIDKAYSKLFLYHGYIPLEIAEIVVKLNFIAETQKYEKSDILNITDIAIMIRFIIGNHKIFFIIWQKKNIDCFIKIDNKKVFDKKDITSDEAEKILIEAMHKIILDEYDACA